jgi:hypothetical protein
MEGFFAPSTRFRDQYRHLFRGILEEDFNNVVEVELAEGSCAGEILLHRGFTWED